MGWIVQLAMGSRILDFAALLENHGGQKKRTLSRFYPS